MIRETALAACLRTGRFDEARELLESHLSGGQVLDPRTDAPWTSVADRIAGAIEEVQGFNLALQFWVKLKDFFIKHIEPAWGHAHKGHIYFRLGVGLLRENLALGKAQLEAAYQEDIAAETARGGTPDEIGERVKNYSAHVALALVERIEDAAFVSPAEKQGFVGSLFTAFDAAIHGGAVRDDLVQKALVTVAPPGALGDCQARYEELRQVAAARLPFATVSLTGTVLESLLLADLWYRRALRATKEGKDLRELELGPLLQQALSSSVFPNEAVSVAFRLVQIFRNRLHPGNELLQKYKLTPRVAMTVRLLFELALLEWGKALAQPQRP